MVLYDDYWIIPNTITFVLSCVALLYVFSIIILSFFKRHKIVRKIGASDDGTPESILFFAGGGCILQQLMQENTTSEPTIAGLLMWVLLLCLVGFAVLGIVALVLYKIYQRIPSEESDDS